MIKSEIIPINLKEKTVFILGAGASQPYGLPLGKDLKLQMNSALSDGSCREILMKLGFSQDLVDEFQESLSGTFHPTIDIFLEKKKKFRNLGAYLIAYTLLPLENHSLLFPQKDWYGHIYNICDFEHNEPDTTKVAFVSLNYDRSLEHFLTKNIKYNCSDDCIKLALSKLQAIEIIHAHGSIGTYPEISYGQPKGNRDTLHSAAEGIRIVSDRLEDSEEFNHAKRVISLADNIVFIGFGYDSTTLGKLFDGIHTVDKRILGTAFHLDEPNVERVSQFFNSKIELGQPGDNAETFIKGYLPL